MISASRPRLVSSVHLREGMPVSSLFTGFPRDLSTHPFSAARNASVSVDSDVIAECIRSVMIAPEQRIVNCQKALKMVQNDPSYQEALAWEAKALKMAERHPFRVLSGVFCGLFAQNAILMYWVFSAFDWNLVEPCTYFFGYTSITWFALVFYKYTGREFTYDAMIDEMRKRKMNKLSLKNTNYVTILADFRHKEDVLKEELRGLGVDVSENMH